MIEHTETPKGSLDNGQVKDKQNNLKLKFVDSIFCQDFTTEIEKKIKLSEPIPHGQILSNLLNKIGLVDFRELANLTESEDLKQVHFQVIPVEQVLAMAQQNKWSLCQNHDFIYSYNGAYWSLIDIDELKGFLGKSASKMGVDNFTSKDYRYRDRLFKQFMALANLPVPDPPQGVVAINLKNGTFEFLFKGIRLRSFSPLDFLTYQLPFEYNPDATAPIFEEYLNRVLPDKSAQAVLAEYLGYVFVQPSTLKLEKALLLYGTGANGKSVFFEVVNALLGSENVSTFSLQSLTNENGYYRAKLANKLVNYASEISGNLETAVFKQIVSGEPIEARLPYGEPFILTRYGKLIFNCNELPKDVEHTRAYFRRFIIIPFSVIIPENEQDTQLAHKIAGAELSGVFNWVLKGLDRLLAQKRFTLCDAARQATEQYEKLSDSVRVFLEDSGYNQSPNGYIPIKDLYTDYRVSCIEDGCKPVSKINFIKRLESCGIVVERKNAGKVAFIEKLITSF